MKTKAKIVSLRSLQNTVAHLKRKGKQIAFTNGCFDILHYGHIDYLEKAKKKDRVLVVGLNSDASIRKIKGPSRPVNSERSRAAVLAALECVDFVVIFGAETPINLIKAVKPDVLIKGADWNGKVVVGSDVVKQSGGKVELIKYLPAYSTTKIINTIKRNCKS